MNVVFAHDHKLRCINGEFYTLGGLSDSITKRYTGWFGNVTIICRAIPKQNFDKTLLKLNNEKLKISPVRSSSLILSKEDRENIYEIVRKSDAVIVRIPSFIGGFVYDVAKKLHKPILSEVVTCPWDSYWNHSLKGKLVAPYITYKKKKQALESDFTLYVTTMFLQQRYPTFGKQIACSDVELNDFDENILDYRLSKIKTCNMKKIVLGTLAALDTRFKGQQFVIQAISILRKKGYDVSYRLAGGGPADYLESCAEKFGVKDSLFIDGSIPHDRVFSWLDSIDLYIQPSLQEGLPRALVEAMSRACPSIGAKTGGIPELVGDEFIFKRKDANAIADKILSLDNNILSRMAVSNLKKSEDFRTKILNERRDKFYLEFRRFVEIY